MFHLAKLYHTIKRMEASTLRLVYQVAAAGSNLPLFAIDQIRWYAMHEYFGDDEEDIQDYLSVAKKVEDIAFDIIKFDLIDRGDDREPPFKQREFYMFEC